MAKTNNFHKIIGCINQQNWVEFGTIQGTNYGCAAGDRLPQKILQTILKGRGLPRTATKSPTGILPALWWHYSLLY